MSPLPPYVSAITIVGVAGILAATSAALYRGSRDAGAGRRAAASTAAATAVLFGAWAAASALVAHHGGYRTQLGKQPPWLPIEATAATAVLLLLARVPAVSRALSGANAVRLLSWPHAFRVAGVALVISMWLGHLPALFAIPAGLGDIAVGAVEPLLSRRITTGHARRATLWFNVVGLTDLVTAMALGGLTAYRIVHVSPANSALSLLPLALIPTVGVPTPPPEATASPHPGARPPAGLRIDRQRSGGEPTMTVRVASRTTPHPTGTEQTGTSRARVLPEAAPGSCDCGAPTRRFDRESPAMAGDSLSIEEPSGDGSWLAGGGGGI